MILFWLSVLISGLALIAALSAVFYLWNTSRRYQTVFRLAEQGDLPGMIASVISDAESLKSIVAHLEEQDAELRRLLEKSVRRTGLVRFDAFDDMGGKLSFAAALLDEKGNGLVISSISGRQESRSYAKRIVNGESDIALSKEEKEAIEQALRS